MATKIQAIRGMNDILPGDSGYWTRLEYACRQLVGRYGYREIRLPLVEHTELFKRTIGDVTDIVEKEMYTFIDRNGDSLTLRPEGTAGCLRAGIEHGLLYNQIQRLWYIGPMFRHERPQKGRYRQFHQLGVEVYGLSEPAIDAELILMSARLWQELGIANHVQLQLNSLGTRDSRACYCRVLVDYLTKNSDQLDDDSRRRLNNNPLRILDSKNPALQPIINAAPKLLDHLDADSQQHFSRLCALLDEAQLVYTINPTLVRGLDYYGRTVFEWVTSELGAQGTVCAGGRYDDLVAQLGGHPTPALGFAAGLERLVLLCQRVHQCAAHADVYAILLGEHATAYGLTVLERVRSTLPHLTIETDLSGGAIKRQLKRADKSGASLALIIGEEERKAQHIVVKDLRVTQLQQALAFDALIAKLQEFKHG